MVDFNRFYFVLAETQSGDNLLSLADLATALSTSITGDHKVMAGPLDSTPDYLTSKIITTGNLLAISISGGAGTNQKARIIGPSSGVLLSQLPVLTNTPDNYGAINAAIEKMGVVDPAQLAANLTGVVGEYLTANTLRSAPVPLTTTVTANVTAALTLTPGDWDISAMIGLLPGGASPQVPVLQSQIGISIVSATLPALDTSCVPTSNEVRFSRQGLGSAATNDVDDSFVISQFKVSITANTDFYLVVNCSFTDSGGLSTISAYGSMQARRVR